MPFNIQPLKVYFDGGNLALSHNGNLTNACELRMKLAKDGGDITAISGATITSRAVVTEVQTVINAAKSLG